MSPDILVLTLLKFAIKLSWNVTIMKKLASRLKNRYRNSSSQIVSAFIDKYERKTNSSDAPLWGLFGTQIGSA